MTDPSGDLDAVLYTSDGGATTPTAIHVWIARRGAEVHWEADAFRGIRCGDWTGTRLTWVSRNELQVEGLTQCEVLDKNDSMSVDVRGTARLVRLVYK